MEFAHFNNFLISYSDNVDIHKFIEEDSYMQILLNQLVFDVLYGYYLSNSEAITAHKFGKVISQKIDTIGNIRLLL